MVYKCLDIYGGFITMNEDITKDKYIKELEDKIIKYTLYNELGIIFLVMLYFLLLIVFFLH